MVGGGGVGGRFNLVYTGVDGWVGVGIACIDSYVHTHTYTHNHTHTCTNTNTHTQTLELVLQRCPNAHSLTYKH